ncbi:hypothetical protein [Roseburia hominis]|uniref:Uncharacterized protein n=1 Tax=Roseburia hominis TaxID=301301 RepID=A0A395VBF1_9FIRM|nr:hypothetical protein [Roseburia hominis]RGS40604.1 hypothetical protein DWX93_09255 [Roseburia hominis]
MEKQWNEYQSADSHKDVKSKIREQNNMQNMETYSQEIVQGNKKVQITLEFPYTVDPRDADRFEHMLKEVYLNKIQKGSLQRSLQAVSFPTPKGKMQSKFACETNSQGGMSHE